MNKKMLTDDFPAPVLPQTPIFSFGFWIELRQSAGCVHSSYRVLTILRDICFNTKSKPDLYLVE
jgi:hypothetical protein